MKNIVAFVRSFFMGNIMFDLNIDFPFRVLRKVSKT